MFWLYLILAGFFGGIFGGMGLGGGTLLVPILTLLLGFSQHFSQAINLFVFIPTAFVAVLFHAKNRLIDFKLFFQICIPAIVCAVLFANLAFNVPKHVLKIIFGIFLICIGVFMACFVLLKKKRKKQKFTDKLGI